MISNDKLSSRRILTRFVVSDQLKILILKFDCYEQKADHTLLLQDYTVHTPHKEIYRKRQN